MIIYFADREFNILGQASTELPKGLTVVSDTKTEEIETGVNIFECYIPFNDSTRTAAEKYTEAGNYLLRSADGENEFYTIVEAEVDTKRQEIYIYAEDAGMDLLNEIVGEFEADQEYPITYYFNKYATDSGFEIGINEAVGLYRKLVFENEETATARLASVAAQFDNCEISFSFVIDGLTVAKKYINIYKQRGNDLGVQLRLNKEISSISITKSITNLATALKCEGGTPDDAEEPITLEGYNYDDGDFFVDGKVLKSRKALERWHRLFTTTANGGHITKIFSDNSTSQADLFNNALAELKKICDIGVNYEIDVSELPDNVKIGDRVNIIDDKGGLYLSSRLLKLQTSIADQKITATLGEYLLKSSGISEKVEKLAADFAKNTVSVKRAEKIATNAAEIATNAKAQAEEAAAEVENATTAANEAAQAANTAAQSAANAQAEAKAAQAAVGKVEESVSSLDKTVTEAKNAANNATLAADTATQKAEEAKTAANHAQANAETAETAAGNAQTAAENATSKANTAIATANTAKTTAEEASAVAQAAKLDAEQAEKDIATFAENLETVENTMKAEYARKTDLTEAKADLQTQITQNAAEIRSTASKVVVIDETANNAIQLLKEAQAAAEEAEAQAEEVIAEAEQARINANTAQAAATEAKANLETANFAAAEANRVATEAETALNAAIADLETVQSRADATEAEIAEAQAAVNTAQNAYNEAVEAVSEAAVVVTEATNIANAALATATEAQNIANEAAENAAIAQKAVDTAKGNAQALAAEKASLAAIAAAEAQKTADNAATEAENAVDVALEAAEAVNTARIKAEAARVTVAEATADLEAAENALAEILANAESTETEIIAAQAEVERANAAKAEAEESAQKAQQAYTDAQTFAENAAIAANNAEKAAEEAQKAVDEAKAVLEKAAIDVGALEKRIITAETSITQNADEIELKATKEEVNNTAKALSESIIKQVADMIRMSVTDGKGQSLMVQTSDGWTFSTASLQNTVNSTVENLNELSDIVGGVENTVDILNKAVEDLGVLSTYVKIGEYVYSDENGTEQREPSIDLGSGANGFKLKITNTKIWFTDGSNDLVWIDSKEKALNTKKIFAEEVKIGGWLWQTRNNGRNLGLVWKGGN